MKDQPKLVDLFCKAGGATKGYQRAGFYVVGIDIEPQPNYCGDEFIQADAVEWLKELVWMDIERHTFAAIHASPPCPRYIRGGLSSKENHPDLVPVVLDLLPKTELPWVLENVPGAPMEPDVVLCGSAFGLRVRRHRWFQVNWPIRPWTLSCDHSGPIVGVYGHPHGEKGAWPGMLPGTLKSWSEAMGIDWMTAKELKDAIPPAYCTWIGKQLFAHLEVTLCQP